VYGTVRRMKGLWWQNALAMRPILDVSPYHMTLFRREREIVDLSRGVSLSVTGGQQHSLPERNWQLGRGGFRNERRWCEGGSAAIRLDERLEGGRHEKQEKHEEHEKHEAARG
jgi:hypothetical protein